MSFDYEAVDAEMEKLKQIDLQNLRELAGAATKGEWTSGKNKNGYDVVGIIHDFGGYDEEGNFHREVDFEGICDVDNEKDADYIAAANPAAIFALLDEIAELRSIEAGASFLNTSQRDEINQLKAKLAAAEAVCECLTEQEIKFDVNRDVATMDIVNYVQATRRTYKALAAWRKTQEVAK